MCIYIFIRSRFVHQHVEKKQGKHTLILMNSVLLRDLWIQSLSTSIRRVFENRYASPPRIRPMPIRMPKNTCINSGEETKLDRQNKKIKHGPVDVFSFLSASTLATKAQGEGQKQTHAYTNFQGPPLSHGTTYIEVFPI